MYNILIFVSKKKIRKHYRQLDTVKGVGRIVEGKKTDEQAYNMLLMKVAGAVVRGVSIT